ncbi:DNA-binding LacI/PurR family transcriptional regulator [Deinococcus metalli]|uniref:DNA-binding LacI/PurR family transcriptional regulator n=1 Tax=Deinococcus metalli TaxID=1141878 RepID=A0A7W8KIC6_9DEIO|nr:LacI family DNA-binding transcriptional regulator [Deinococcus metalli]MBB5377039.1 DNA-binding LacI/PurR family transcriptional regulator [Deinococcus metalli]GHF49383.1 lac repressor [Deinococcus metalli]
MTDRNRTVTLADVAALADVSQQTVSRVVTGHGPVAPRTRARVNDAIAQLNYVPNRLATGLARQRTYSVGFATNDLSLHAPSQLTAGIEHAAREAGYSLLVSIVAANGLAAVTHTLRGLRERQVDGVLLNASLSSADAVAVRQRFPGLPCVFMDVPLGTLVPAALLDQGHGARQAADHLLALGHTRIAFVDGPRHAVVENARPQAWRAALAARDLAPVAVVEGDWSPASGYAATLRLLAGGVPFTAILVANDQMAVGVLRALWERGLNVPADVSVVGYDDTPESALLIPPLTTVRQDFPTLGARAFAHLLSLLDRGEDAAPPPVLTVPDLVVRASTAPPSGERQGVQAALDTLRAALLGRG